MPSSDKDVEIRITGSVDGSVEASTAKARASIESLSASARTLTITQRSMAQAILDGKISLDDLAVSLGKTSQAKEAMAAISRSVAEAQGLETSAVEAAAASRIELSRADSEQLSLRLGLAKQQSAETLAQDSATLAFQQRMTKQRAAAAVASEAEIAAARTVAAKADEAASVAAFAFQQRMTGQRVKQEVTASAEVAAAQALRAKETEAVAATTYALQQRLTRQRVKEEVTADAEIAAARAAEAKEEEAIAATTLAFQKRMTAQRIAEAEATTTATGAQDSFLRKLTSGRSVYEGEAAARAILTGNMGRLGSAIAVETARLNLLQYVFSPLGLTIGAVTAAIAAITIATLEYNEAIRKAEISSVGMGAASQLSGAQIEAAAEHAASASTIMVGSARTGAEVFAAAGVTEESTLRTLTASISDYAKLTGEKAKEATKDLADAMKDPIKGADDLNSKLHFLTVTEREHIYTMERMGDTAKAQAEITKDLKEREDEAAIASGGLASGMDQVANAASKAWTWVGKLNSVLREYSAEGAVYDAMTGEAATAKAKTQAAAAAALQRSAALTDIENKGYDAGAKTPAGEEKTKFAELQGDAEKLRKSIGAARLLGDAAGLSELSQRYKEVSDAIGRVTDAHGRYITQAEREHEIVQLQKQEVDATKQHKAALRGEIAEKIAYLKAGDTPETNAQALQHAQDEGALATARGEPSAKKPKDDQVAIWREQLETQLEDEKNFFGESTAEELKFWQSKLSLVAKGSKDEREVRRAVYEAERSLAHQTFDEKVASYNDELAAQRDDWANEQAILKEKLDYIGRTAGVKTTVYKDAHRALEEAERAHARTMREIQRANDKEALDELKINLSSNRTIRNADAREAEAEVQYKAKGSANPLAEVSAEQKIAALHRQTAQQDLADMAVEKAAADKLLDTDIANAIKGSVEWANANKAKKTSDAEWAARHSELVDQIVNQEKADIRKIQDAWRSAIAPEINTIGSQIEGLIEKTETWGQALRNIARSILSELIQAGEKWLVTQLVNLATGQAAQQASAKASVVALAGQAGAGGVASMAAAPFPMDLTALDFGAAMFAGAMTLGSFDKGVNVVPRDMIAQVHAGERIVPRGDNSALIAAASGGGRTAGVHVTNHFSAAFGGEKSFRQQLSAHENDIAAIVERTVRNAVRNGRLR